MLKIRKISLRRGKKKIARSSSRAAIMNMSLINIILRRCKKWNTTAWSFLIPKRIGMLSGKEIREANGKEAAYVDKVRIVAVGLPSSWSWARGAKTSLCQACRLQVKRVECHKTKGKTLTWISQTVKYNEANSVLEQVIQNTSTSSRQNQQCFKSVYRNWIRIYSNSRACNDKLRPSRACWTDRDPNTLVALSLNGPVRIWRSSRNKAYGWRTLKAINIKFLKVKSACWAPKGKGTIVTLWKRRRQNMRRAESLGREMTYSLDQDWTNVGRYQAKLSETR